MKKLLANLILTAISLYAVDAMMETVQISTTSALLTASLIMVVVNVTLKPILKFLSLPFNLMTFGLFSLIVNGALFSFVLSFVDGASVSGFGAAVIAAIVLSVVNYALEKIMEDN